MHIHLRRNVNDSGGGGGGDRPVTMYTTVRPQHDYTSSAYQTPPQQQPARLQVDASDLVIPGQYTEAAQPPMPEGATGLMPGAVRVLRAQMGAPGFGFDAEGHSSSATGNAVYKSEMRQLGSGPSVAMTPRSQWVLDFYDSQGPGPYSLGF
ncbi:hypothetical protein COL154_013737 [Colletotrichum chrysophilum]|nr:hypothetical protein COL154_013737 [Colletotrichum chrysophilum]